MSELISGVRAVIFDISGTVMDFGSRGPVAAFVEWFARHGVEISHAEARKPMGKHKLDHVKALLAEPAIAERWRAANGSVPSEQALLELYASFGPLQTDVLRHHLDLLPGVPAVTAELRRRGCRVASTTGFETAMLDQLKSAAASQGYEPECWICPDQVGGGRPAPWMIFEAARRLGVYPPRTFVKVGDTPADIGEARNAGAWAVAVVSTGNEIGLSRAEWDALTEQQQRSLTVEATAKFRSLGADYVIDSVADLLPVIDEISARIERGENPGTASALNHQKAQEIAGEVIELLAGSAGEQYFGEAVTKLEHALQCAWHAQRAGADEELILAALVHDIGHLLETADTVRDEVAGVVNHDETGATWLQERGFGPRLVELVGGHVDAKRYLTAANRSYAERLSSASSRTLRLQGGPMTASEACQFAQDPGFRDKLRLRSWDEAAKDRGWQGPGIEEYRAMIVRYLTRIR